MKKLAQPVRIVAFTLIAVAAATAVALADWDQISWYDGAAGYREAVKLSDTSGRPVLVYFYTDWCPYCRQLNNELLSDGAVQGELDAMLAVRVNAENGPDEKSLAAHYRVRGYPALYFYSPEAGGSFEPIRRTVGAAGGARLKTPDEFVATLRAAGR